MTIIYIHGFLSSSDSKVQQLKECFPNYSIIGIDYNISTFNNEFIMSTVNFIKSINDEVVLIGTSLGSLVTSHISSLVDVRTILINPIRYMIKDIFITDTSVFNYVTNQQEVISSNFVNFVNTIQYHNNINGNLSIVGLQDDIINIEKTIEYFRTQGDLKTLDIGHRVDIKDIQYVLANFINNIHL